MKIKTKNEIRGHHAFGRRLRVYDAKSRRTVDISPARYQSLLANNGSKHTSNEFYDWVRSGKTRCVELVEVSTIDCKPIIRFIAYTKEKPSEHASRASLWICHKNLASRYGSDEIFYSGEKRGGGYNKVNAALDELVYQFGLPCVEGYGADIVLPMIATLLYPRKNKFIVSNYEF